MKSNIIKNVLFSVALHGVALACCFAVPAQKLIPLFQAGNSSLTLTSLAVSQPAGDQPENVAAQKQETENKDAVVIEDNEENSTDDLLDIHDKKSAPVSTQKPQNQRTPIDADAHLKGIAGGRAGNSEIRPYYPLGARLRGEEGVVKVEVCVGVNGHAFNCAVVKSSGFMALDDAALAAVKHARFVTASGTAPSKDSKTVLTFRFDIVD